MIELLSLDLSNYCSKQCGFCYNHSNREGNTMWTPEEVMSFSKDCVKHGVKAISLGGGEPFEFEGIFQVIEALFPIVYLSVTSNGLPLLNDEILQQLILHAPDKIHITIHQPDDNNEVERVVGQIRRLKETNIKPGVNLLVSNKKIESCKHVYQLLREIIQPDQIIMVPQRFSCTPSPQQLASVTGGAPFQSPSCLLGCKRPTNFCSVSWDKRVNSCSFADGKERLEELTYNGLIGALQRVKFVSC